MTLQQAVQVGHREALVKAVEARPMLTGQVTPTGQVAGSVQNTDFKINSTKGETP